MASIEAAQSQNLGLCHKQALFQENHRVPETNQSIMI
jgi:hypothetical protein